VAKVANSPGTSPKRRPALSPEARESQMIALTMDLVEQRLLDGTASSAETTHFLKLATEKYRVELQTLKADRKLKEAKTEDIESRKETKAMYENALKAMRRYSGQDDVDDDTDIF
jgi:uncharacterized tellurite resistance protein B-like protein